MTTSMTMSSTLAPRLFFGGYILLFAALAISPYDRTIWFVENFPIVVVVLVIAWIRRYHEFSNVSYAAMAVLVTLHTIGAHYTFALVPFDWITDGFAFDRNHFDRIAHFSVGFYAYPIAELLHRRRMVNSRLVLVLFPVSAIIAVAGLYEVFEWQFALLADPNAGLAVLGSQGDVWDAQKDITADSLGAMLAMVVYLLINPQALRKPLA